MSIKEELKEILEHPPLNYTEDLLIKMLTFIGDPDSELRDSIICNLFYAGIPSGQVSIKQQQWLLNQILDKNLVMTGIDQEEGDLVFTRTSSCADCE